MPRWKAEAKKREEEKKAEAKKPQSSSVKNVNNKAQNSTFMGGGAPVKKAEKTYQNAKKPSAKARQVAEEQKRRRELEQHQNQKTYGDQKRATPRRTTSTSNNLTQHTTAAQRQKMGMPTAEDLRQGREHRRALANSVKNSVRRATSEENRAFMQRQKSGTLTSEDKKKVERQNERRKEVAENTGRAATKGVQDTLTGYGKTLADVDEMAKSNKNWTRAKASKMGISEDDTVGMAKVEGERQKSIKQAQELRRDLAEKQDKRQAEFDERTKNAKGLEKAWYGAVESGTGMATDALVGALTGTGTAGSLASMAVRTYGTTRGQAEKEGATENEDRAYAVLQAAKEVGTELMFPGAGLAKKAYGKAGLSVADRVADSLTKGMTGNKADLVGAGVRLLGGTAEENAEELAGWGLDPVIKELTYAKNVRKREAQKLLKQESDELRSNLKSAGDARSVAAYLGSDRFLADNIAQYKDAGLSDKQAREVAEKMRDYLTASLTGDTDRMGDLEDEIVTTVAGGSLKAMIKDYDVGELIDTFASTSVLTLATGLPATATTAMKGARIRENLGSEGLRALSQTAINFEDDEASLKGQAARDRLDSGKDLTSTQVYDLAKAQAEQIQKDEKRVAAMSNMADNAIKSEKLVTPKIGFRENGSVAGDEIITMNYVNESNNATEIISDLLKEEGSESLTDTEVQTGSRAIAGFKTGAFTVNDANALNYTNTTVRTAFEAATGVNLSQYVVRKNGQVDIPATNAATKDALFAMAADNFVKTAQAETANWMDSVKGDVVTQVTERMGAQGSLALQQALDDVDERDRSTYMMNANAADMMYQTARNMGTEWDSVKAEARKMFPDISETKLEAMYNAGLRDRADAANGAIGQQVRMGETMALQNEPSEPKGKVFVDTTATPKGTVVRTFSEIASNLGVDIHLVDDLKTSTGGQANGQYVNGAIYINMNSDFESNIGYIFMHEVTHHLKQYAPEQFNELENLVREKWFGYNPEQMQNEIAKKIDLYKRNGQTLSEEEALEEIIADAAHEFINDRNFADQVAEQNPDIAKAILNGIRNALRMLRRLFATGSIDDETHMNSLFSQLNILDEAEKLWLNAYTQAVQNKAAVAIDEWQDRANGEPKQSITTDKEDFVKGANLSKELRDWAKEMGLDKLSSQPVKGPVIVSVRDLRTAWYEKNGRAEEANVINTALDKIGDSLTKLVGEYQYIDLGDALNAAVTYRTDAEGHPTSVILSCQVKNAEYEVNFDFTTICAKRLAMQKILERFIKTEGERQGTTLYDELKLDEEGLYKLRLILETAGFEVSCRGCFVEQNRYSQQNQARTIANDWNAALDEWAKDNGTEVTENFGLTTLDIDNLDYEEIEAGFERYHELMKGKKTDVATKNRMLIEASPFFRKRMNASDYASMAGQRALMAIGESKKGGTNLYGLLKRGQSDSKQSVPFTAYNGEISLLPDNMKGKSLYDYLLSIGGARAQSASDFQIEFVYDYMQMVADLSARGLPMHMYTKVIELAELFGMTGIKINLSAMCDVAEDLGGEYAGLKLVDGKYEYNISDQSIDYEKAVALQKKDGYSKNIGIIMVTLSSQHMLKSLDDPDVRYIIGYHSSAMPVVVANMSNMGGATDYTKINKTNKLNEKGKALFDAAMEEAKGNTELEKYKDALRIFDEKIQEETAKKKKLPRRGNEYGSYMSAYGGNTADFNTYDSLLETKDARKTADKYLEYCMKNDLIPIYFPFAFHENYYKCEIYDFNMYDNNTGEYAPMESVQNIYPDLNMAAGETDTTAFTERVSQMMDEQNRVNKSLDSQYDAVFDEAKNTLKYSITGDDYMDMDASGIDHSELTHRADATKTEAQMRDDAYMDAVNSGDMETAQRLVDEAAKSAGYNTPRLYHGTPSFGFTTFDLGRGENIIFATSSPLTAETYSGETDRRNISDAASLNVDELYGESLLKEASKYRGKYKDYRLMTPAEQERLLDESRKDVESFARVASDFIDEHRDAFNAEKLEIANRIVNALDRVSTAWADDMVDSAWNDYEDAVWDLKWIDESIQMELTQALQNNGSLLYAKNRVSDFMYAGDIYRNKDYEADYVFDNQLALELDADLHKGIYGLYGRADNQLVIDAEGSNWNQIKPPEELNLYGPQKTRWIAEAAMKKGYDSVLFKNLKDNGGGTAYNGLSDVYMFFNPNQVKSADPVTYAEDGLVIPLSERFDPTNNDIRYSLPTQDSDGKILTDGQMEYFKNSQARDSQGRLVRVFHTTNHGGFTVFDPSYSDDKRSLFFASNWYVSQTYGRNANEPIDINVEPKQLDSFEEFEEWWGGSFKGIVEKFGFDIYRGTEDNKEPAYEFGANPYLRVGKYIDYAEGKIQDPQLEGIPYIIHTAGGDYGSYSDFLNYVASLIPNQEQRGYYSCYLNMENPLIVDAHGANWNRIPYGEPAWNPTREKTLKKMESEAAFIIDHIESEWEDFDDDFDNGAFRGLSLEITGKRRKEDGSFEDWNVSEHFTVNEDELAEYDDFSSAILSTKFASYLTEDLGWSYDYYEEIANHANDANGDIDFTPSFDNQEKAPDYITSDGYKMDYAEIFDEFSEEDDFKFEPYEGVNDTTYKTRELAEIAQSNGYDGVIIRNCRDIGGVSYLAKGSNPISDIYIAFSSNQVKDIDNENPTENPDIRYSIPDEEETMNLAQDKAKTTDDVWATDPVTQEGRIRKKNGKQDFINGVTNKWNPAWKTEGKVLKDSSVEKAVRDVIMGAMRESNTTAKYRQSMVKKTMLVARQAFNMMKNDEYAKAAELLYDHAYDMIENLEFFGNDDKSEFERYKELREYLRTTKITVPEDKRSDIDYASFRKKNFGKILLGDGGTAPDVAWQRLNELWPEAFTEDIKGDAASIMLQMENALDIYEPYATAYSSEQCVEFAGDIADSLYDIIYEGEEYKSLADKYTDKSKAMKARHAEAMEKVKQNYKDRLNKQRLDAKRKEYARLEAQKERISNKYEERLSNVKDKYERKIRAQKRKADFEIATLKQNREYNIQRLKAEKARAVKEERQRGSYKRAESLAKQREKQMHRQLYNRVLKEYNDLTHRLLHPTKDKAKNIPEQLRQPLAQMLHCFDLEKERSKKLEEMYMIPTRSQLNFRELKDAFEKVIKEDPTAYELSDVHKYMADKMTELADRVDGKSIDALDIEDIKVVKDLLVGLNAGIKNAQQLEIDGENYQKQQMCDKVGEGAAEHQKLYGKAKKYGNNDRPGIRAYADHIVNMGELTPIYFFRQIKGMYDMYRQMRKGFNTYVRNEKKIIDKIADILSDYYKTNRKGERIQGSEIEEWRHSESAETFPLMIGNQTITLTIAQKMSLYCLAKRSQAQMHMYSENGGIVASETSAGSKIHQTEERYKGKTVEYKPVYLTPADVDAIISTLTEDQKTIADQLQKLMSTDMAELGNEASVKLTGIEMYKEQDYFPIKVMGESLPTNPENIGIREKIRNPGFSNPLQENASNPIIVDDIFAVVASHCNEMNQYASYAVPITNFMKVYNGSVINEEGKAVKIKTVLKETYGEKALTYIENFIDDINGNSFKRHGGIDDVLDKVLGQAKKAAVFANLRVALQQPTAIIRALAVMNPKYFMGVHPSTKATKEMIEHCPIAQWKALGYFDTHFGRDIEDVMMGRDVSSKGEQLMSEIYGQLDNMTWGMIWQAVKNEVKATHKGIDETSQEFWDLCEERASFVFDSTQVVDSPFHRSNDMRSKDRFVKQLTSFQAEPTLSFNVLRQGFVDAYEALRKGDIKKARRIVERVLGVWVAQALTVALAQSIVDALRRKGHKKKDDEEDEMLTWYQEFVKYFFRNFGNNFKDDLNPINNIYFVKDIVPPIMNAIKGEYVYGTQSLTTQWVDTLTNGISMCKKKWEKGDADSHTWYDCLTELFGGLGYLKGIPAKTMMRGTKNAFHWAGKIFGINVFADDGKAVDKAVDSFVDNFRGDGSTDEGGGLFDSIANKMGYRKSDESSGDTEESKADSADIDAKLKDYEESLSDTYTDKQKKSLVKQYKKTLEKEAVTEAAMSEDFDVQAHIAEAQANFDYEMEKRSIKAAEMAAGKTGRQRDEALWDVISEGYTKSVDSGNMATIQRMREEFAKQGGDTEWFDAKIADKMKSAYKKTLYSSDEIVPGASLRQETMYNFMTAHGVSEKEISDIVYHSYVARDLKAAMRIGNEDYIMDELVPLVAAGLSREDYEKLYKYRNMGAKTYDGKYTDPKYTKTTGTFVWPTEGVITSHFGYRNAPTAGASSNHPAIDIGAPSGTTVVAADGGVVIYAGSNGGYGNSVGVKHANGMVTYYNHLSAWNVKVGDQVAQGQPIANVGSTGISTGPHLDFKILDADGNPVDPEKYLNKRS